MKDSLQQRLRHKLRGLGLREVVGVVHAIVGAEVVHLLDGELVAEDTIESLNAIQKVLGKLPSTAGKAACAPRIQNKSMFQR